MVQQRIAVPGNAAFSVCGMGGNEGKRLHVLLVVWVQGGRRFGVRIRE
jgi:hypothetical protein